MKSKVPKGIILPGDKYYFLYNLSKWSNYRDFFYYLISQTTYILFVGNMQLIDKSLTKNT